MWDMLVKNDLKIWGSEIVKSGMIALQNKTQYHELPEDRNNCHSVMKKTDQLDCKFEGCTQMNQRSE